MTGTLTRRAFVRRSAGVALAVYLGSWFRPPPALPADPATLAEFPPTPVGYMHPFDGAAPPPGWLVCDGSTVPISSYPALFAVIGDTYGGSRWSRVFRVPDLRGRIRDDAGTTRPLTAIIRATA